MIERLRAVRLSVRRGRREVVAGLDRVFARGRVHWVLGDNGGGKSSLLRVLAGRERPAGGRLVAETAGGPLGRRPSSVYYAPAMRIPPDVRVGSWRRFTGALTADGAGPGLAPPAMEAGRRLGRTSTGEAKRLLLDALLAAPAEVTVLDEPFEHLAAAGRRRLTRFLVRRAAGSVVVVATHHGVPGPARPGDVLRLEPPGPEAGRRVP